MKECRDAVKEHFIIDGVITVPSPWSAPPSCSGPNTRHYSFDFAQQVHYPHNPLQPRPMYFKTARKCAVFGICCEGIPRQINYLIDKASDCGKGANTVICLLPCRQLRWAKQEQCRITGILLTLDICNIHINEQQT